MLSCMIFSTAQVIWVSVEELLCCSKSQAGPWGTAITAGIDNAGEDKVQSSSKNGHFSDQQKSANLQ